MPQIRAGGLLRLDERPPQQRNRLRAFRRNVLARGFDV
jgi:hypothetical protein